MNEALAVLCALLVIVAAIIVALSLVLGDFDEACSLFWRRVFSALPKTDVQKAVAERQAEIDRRTAQLIREHGYDQQTAASKAERQYTEEMKEATP